MSASRPGSVVHYAVAVVAVAVASAVRVLLNPVLGNQFPFAALFLAILVAAGYGGFGPALVATGLGAVVAVVLLLPAPEPVDPGLALEAGLALYAVVGVGIALLGGKLRAARVDAEAAAGRAAEEAGTLSGILVVSVDHIYVLDRDGRYRQVSAGGARVLGFAAHEVVGKHWTELGLPRALMGPFDAIRERVLATGVPSRQETVFLTADGEERRFEYIMLPVATAGGPADAVVAISRDVTERRRAEAALREVKGLLDAVIDHAPACIFAKDREGRYLLANRALAALVGADPAAMVGKTDREFFPPALVEQFARDDAAVLAAAAPRTYEESFAYGGAVRTFLTVKFPLRDADGRAYAACAVAADITELKRTEAALRAAESRLSAILEHSPAVIFVKDRDGRYLLINREFEAMARASGIPGPYLGKTDAELIAPDDAARFRADDLEVMATRKVKVYEETVQVGDERRTGLSTKFPLLDERGEVHGVCAINLDITPRVRAEEALRRSEERLRLALAAGRMGVWDWDLRTGAIRWSDDLEPIHGLAPGSFGGTIDAFRALVHPDDSADVDAAIERAVADKTSYAVEFRNLRPDGAIRWMAAKGTVVAERGAAVRMIGVALDVTERVRGERDARFLADASAALAGLVDDESTLQKVARLAVPHFADWCAVDMLGEPGGLRRVAVAHVDPTRVGLANELHRRYPPDPDAPGGAWAVIRTGRPELVARLDLDALAQIAEPGLVAGLRALGLRSYMGVPLAVRGRVIGVVSFVAAESGRIYDERDLAVAEDLAHRAAVAIENAQLYHAVREADRRKDEFLALLGHELRNPLAPIRSALQVLGLPGADAAVIRRAREVMERQVEHTVRLVDDLLDVSRIMRGKVELRRAPVELAVVVARAVETTQPAIDAGAHRLAIVLPPEPLWIDGDLVRLAQLVANLLDNAAKYTDRGGRIDLTAVRDGDHVVLCVRDDGVGIRPEVLPHLFDMFFQAERRTEASRGGLGIGLSLVRGLAELHGGGAWARSEGPGAGSEFVVRLPLLVRGDAAADAAPEPAVGPPLPPRRVLVVDDNVDAADSLAMLLGLRGQDVRVAYDGPGALAAAAEDPPAVAFLDLGMPGMDGYELARRMRKDPALNGVVLVALTGWGQAEDRARSRDAGFDHHLVKPVDPSAVEALLAALPRPRLGDPDHRS